jgi:hypothetical protein
VGEEEHGAPAAGGGAVSRGKGEGASVVMQKEGRTDCSVRPPAKADDGSLLLA